MAFDATPPDIGAALARENAAREAEARLLRELSVFTPVTMLCADMQPRDNALQRFSALNAGMGYQEVTLGPDIYLTIPDQAPAAPPGPQAAPFSCAAGSPQYREPDFPPTDSRTLDVAIPQAQLRQLDLSDEGS